MAHVYRLGAVREGCLGGGGGRGYEGGQGFLQHSHIPTLLLPTTLWPWTGLLTVLGPVFPISQILPSLDIDCVQSLCTCREG